MYVLNDMSKVNIDVLDKYINKKNFKKNKDS